MTSNLSPFKAAWGKVEWRFRSEQLFREADRTKNAARRELIHRRAVAAQNISESIVSRA